MAIKGNHSALTMTLHKILKTSIVTTQEDLRKQFEANGFVVTQATISRLLRKMRVTKKVNQQGQVIYALPELESPPITRVRISDLILNIESNETLTVIKTKPGSAQLIASILDYQVGLPILGTVAGDDTIFIAPCLGNKPKKLQMEIEKLLTHIE